MDDIKSHEELDLVAKILYSKASAHFCNTVLDFDGPSEKNLVAYLTCEE